MASLTDPSVLLIFTSAPTGLGHLRVMDGLKEGLLTGIDHCEVGLQNFSANKIHALGSRIPLLTKITEFYQTNPIAEAVVSKIYLTYLRFRTKDVDTYFQEVAKKYPTKKTWVIVCTHFNLAHPIAEIKNSLEKSFNVKILLAVVVTDDSPQRVWAVDGADIIFSPSEVTSNKLKEYLPNKNVVKTVSFPLSPKLLGRVSPETFSAIENQLNPTVNQNTHVQIPISGAAVQLPFIQNVMQILVQQKFEFTVVGQKNLYTNEFLQLVSKLPRTQVSIGFTAKETVDYYESVFFQSSKATLEITKPSEQMFKALLNPSQYGGVLLLLTSPVGRQERDNLAFLTRHQLMPSYEETESLNRVALGHIPDPSELATLRYKASHWRAVSLPTEPSMAADFIIKLKNYGIFYAMLSYSSQSAEFSGNGVENIWKEITNAISLP